MGFTTALSGAFTLHQLNHAHWRELNDDGYPVAKPSAFIDDWRSAGPPRPAVKDAP
jgi:enoyl-CoA hydratase